MENINNKTFEHRPITELLSIVRNDYRQLDDEGLIDEGNLIKVVKYCNDRLGIPLRQVKEVCIPVHNFKAKLPLNFEKLYYAAAVNTGSYTASFRNPFDNNFDADVVYEANVDRDSLGCVDNYLVTIKRHTNVTVHNTGSFVTLDLSPSSHKWCHNSCPNMRKKGKHTIDIDGDVINTPFKSGEIYIMYLATMEDEEGNVLFPFHPMITPYYEWSIVEKVLMNAVFNSDGDYAAKLQLAQREKAKAWLDAFDVTTSKGYGEYVDLQRKKELKWYNEYFKYFQ